MIFFMVVGGEPETHIQRLIIDENLIVRIGQDDWSACTVQLRPGDR